MGSAYVTVRQGSGHPQKHPQKHPSGHPPKTPPKRGFPGGENPGGKFRENFPGPGGPGPARPGRPARGSPGAPGTPPRNGPFWALIMVYLFRNGVNPPPRRDPARVHFWHPPGGCKKCTFFWVFNNSPSRDSLVTFFRFFRSRGVPGNPPKPPPGTPPRRGVSWGCRLQGPVLAGRAGLI